MLSALASSRSLLLSRSFSSTSSALSATVQQFINGKRVDATSSETFPNINPATKQVISQVQVASEADVNDAVNAAKEAFEVWSSTTVSSRAKVLHAAARILREKCEEIARAEATDVGKTFAEAKEIDMPSAWDCLEYYSGVAPTLHGTHHTVSPNSFAYTIREPLGVCGGLGAWNYPLQVATWKSAPALACGNTVVFKPSELTPTSAMLLAEAYIEAGAPPGVFNVVHGKGKVGSLITEHPDIAKVSLTGSVPTGKVVMASAAKSLKHVTLELGGKSPLVIFPSASIKNAISGAMLANFYTQGEVCSNGTRVFVHESIYDEFVSGVVERTKALKVGDPFVEETQVGSLISEDHMKKVSSYIKIGQEEGATLAFGGEEVTKDDTTGKPLNGSFIRPAVFADCTDDMRITREEIFGPVMSILKFKTEEEVIRRANDTPFGLAAGVFTTDLSQGHRVISKLQAGTCWINNFNICPIEVPFGGYKQSGIGRENGLATIEYYSQLKTCFVELGDAESTL